MSHLGDRHELARQRRRQRAVGNILGDELKSEIFAELIEYEKAIAEQRRKDYKVRELKNKMNNADKFRSVILHCKFTTSTVVVLTDLYTCVIIYRY